MFSRRSVQTFESPEQVATGIGNVNMPVTIEDCQFSGSTAFAINIGEVNGNISIRGNTLNDTGISLVDVNGSIDVSNNTIEAASAPAGLMASDTSDISFNNNTVKAMSSIFTGLDSVVRASGNGLDGDVIAGGGEVYPSRIGLTNNEFSSSMYVIDGTGSLYNDPMADGNSGMSPGRTQSLIDFDGNGCVDYPPERNQEDPDAQKCVTDGIAPPGG